MLVGEPGRGTPRSRRARADPAGRRLAAQLGGQRGRLGPHLGPVLDGGPHLLEHQLDPGPQHREALRVGLVGDLGVDHRLGEEPEGRAAGLEHLRELAVAVAHDAHHRVDHQLDVAALPAQLHDHRVDDERHVVGDDLEHGVGRGPPVTISIGVVDPDLGLAPLAMARGPPMGHDGAAEVGLVAVGEVLGRDPVVVLTHELLVGVRGLVGELPPDGLAQRFDQVLFEITSLDGHSHTPHACDCMASTAGHDANNVPGRADHVCVSARTASTVRWASSTVTTSLPNGAPGARSTRTAGPQPCTAAKSGAPPVTRLTP